MKNRYDGLKSAYISIRAKGNTPPGRSEQPFQSFQNSTFIFPPRCVSFIVQVNLNATVCARNVIVGNLYVRAGKESLGEKNPHPG